jgi:ABC-type spermidine/putrescine transport system permease subunit II
MPEENEGLTEGQKRALIIGAVVVALLVLVGAIWAAIALVNSPAQAATWRDVFIIFMALEAMLIGIALLVLIMQLAVLTNMLKHEIKPILESTNETVNAVRGTTLFVSENLVEPIMKLNGYVAGIVRMAEVISSFGGLGRQK